MKAIYNQLVRFVQWIKSKFTGKNQTIDGITDVMKLRRRTSVDENGQETIEFIDHDGNVVDTKNFDLVIKPILIKMGQDGQLMLELSKMYKPSQKVVGHEKVGQAVITRNWKFLWHQPHMPELMALALIKNQSKLNELNESVKYFIQCIQSPTTIDATQWMNEGSKLETMYTWLSNEVRQNRMFEPVSFNQVITFAENIRSINDSFNQVDIKTPDVFGAIQDKDVIVTINGLADVLVGIQIGINVITSSMKQVYQIDQCFIETIESIDELDRFVKLCINNNIPPKYVAYNAYLISSKDIRGSAKINKPIMGQSRVVFMNAKNTVYKIALSNMGIQGNRTELAVFNNMKKINLDHLLAKVLGTTRFNTVNEYEKVTFNTTTIMNMSKKQSIAHSLAEQIKQGLMHANQNYAISDIHYDNIGLRGKQPVVIDYGNITHISQNIIT